MDFLNEHVLSDLELVPLLINLVLVILLCQILAWHYQRFSLVLSNKRKFARIFVFIGATTMLVISVVKSSLALSLGLVGALSIIRFRTPIKEPEDLAYLFLALAAGIGLGADQRAVTVVVFLGILGIITISRWLKREKGDEPRVYAHVNAPLDGKISSEEGLNSLIDKVKEQCGTVDLRRVDSREDELNATLILDLKDTSEIGALIRRIQEVFPAATVSIVEGATFVE